MTYRPNPLTLAASTIALALVMPLMASAEPQRVMAGTVVDFHGKYGLVVRDARGALAEVTLHPGTIIKPVGLRLERGMKVIIVGQAANEAFAAGEIDAPLEVWPPARAAAIARAQGRQPDPMALSPTRPNAGTRWTEGPDQFSVPQVKEPVNPH
jgi:hypothetical protein